MRQCFGADDTDWPRIVALHQLAPLDNDDRIAGHQRPAAVQAHLLELAGDTAAARAAYQRAARQTTSRPEQRYLCGRAARLDE